ncbi:MAG TPA: cytochrome c class I [Anaerolineae bacterium]|nr:cytochrome c class I [Anaerolineae bacterium]
MKKVWFACVCVLFLLSACSAELSSSNSEIVIATVPASYSSLINPLSEDAAVAGAEIFATNCATCHGSGGHGDGPAGAALNPPPKDLSALQVQVSDGYLFWKISEGSPGTAMVAWRGILTEEQIWHLVTFIRTLK